MPGVIHSVREAKQQLQEAILCVVDVLLFICLFPGCISCCLVLALRQSSPGLHSPKNSVRLQSRSD